jgi:thermostable 8-oxoguanine DNA glycosylase
VFVGGTDTFKDAWTCRLAAAAKARGKHCHVGRVNGRRRLRLATQAGCDSVDGSSLSRFPRTWIPKFVDDCRQLQSESDWLAALPFDRPLVTDEVLRRDGIIPPVLWRAPMVDPFRITDYNRDDEGLDEFLVFAVAVAGKDSSRTAQAVRRLRDRLAAMAGPVGPRFLDLLARFSREEIAAALHECGIHPHNQKAEALHGLASAWQSGTFDPRTCILAQLEAFRYVGSKTARFFLMHSRPGQRLACLDTHVLKHLRSRGVPDVSSKTPDKRSATYRRLEERFLRMADEAGMSPADYDLSIWRAHAEFNRKVQQCLTAEGTIAVLALCNRSRVP